MTQPLPRNPPRWRWKSVKPNRWEFCGVFQWEVEMSFPRDYRHFIFVSNACWQYVVTQTCENKLSNAPMSNLFSKFRKISSNGANDCAWVENCGRIQLRVEMSNGQCPFIHNERSLRVFLVWLTLTWLTCFNSRWRNISRLKSNSVASSGSEDTYSSVKEDIGTVLHRKQHQQENEKGKRKRWQCWRTLQTKRVSCHLCEQPHPGGRDQWSPRRVCSSPSSPCPTSGCCSCS